MQLQRLYWFTIEFGVIQEQGKIQSYGAGILASFGETNQIHEQKANFSDYSIEKIIQKVFRTDIMQEDDYVISSFNVLFESLKKLSRVGTNDFADVE